MKRPIFRYWFCILALAMIQLAGGGLLAGCAPAIRDDQPYLEIKEGWARTSATPVGSEVGPDDWKTPVGPLGLGPNGLVFMQINNLGGAADRLVKAESAVAESVELHQMVISGQRTVSVAVKAIDLPAKTLTKLQSGGFYIRLVGLKRPLANGAKFDVTLEFETSGKRKVEVVVANP